MKNLRKLLPVMQMERDARLGRKGFRPGLEILIFLAVFYVSNVIQSIPIAIITVISMFASPEFTELLNEITSGGSFSSEQLEELIASLTSSVMLPSLFCTAATIAAVFIYCRCIEKRPLRSLGLRKGHIAAEYLAGLLVGAVLFSLAVGICILTGSLSVQFVAYGLTALVPVYFIGFLIQGMSEELLCRGYLMLSISRRSSMAWAIFWNSVLFAALHLLNPGVNLLAILNLILFGVFASVYFLKRGNIWGIGAIHSIWNFMQGNFFGIPVSGAGNLPSVCSSAVGEGFANELWNGGAFGLEGGLAVTIVLTLATAAMLFIPAKRSELAPPEEAETAEAPEPHPSEDTDNDAVTHID